MSKKIIKEKGKYLFKTNGVKSKLSEKRANSLSFLASDIKYTITISDTDETLQDVIIKNENVINNGNRILAQRIEAEKKKLGAGKQSIVSQKVIIEKNVARKVFYRETDKKVDCVNDYTKRFIKRKRTEIEETFNKTKEANKRTKLDNDAGLLTMRLRCDPSLNGIICL